MRSLHMKSNACLEGLEPVDLTHKRREGAPDDVAALVMRMILRDPNIHYGRIWETIVRSGYFTTTERSVYNVDKTFRQCLAVLKDANLLPKDFDERCKALPEDLVKITKRVRLERECT